MRDSLEILWYELLGHVDGHLEVLQDADHGVEPQDVGLGLGQSLLRAQLHAVVLVAAEVRLTRDREENSKFIDGIFIKYFLMETKNTIAASITQITTQLFKAREASPVAELHAEPKVKDSIPSTTWNLSALSP